MTSVCDAPLALLITFNDHTGYHDHINVVWYRSDKNGLQDFLSDAVPTEVEELERIQSKQLKNIVNEA